MTGGDEDDTASGPESFSPEHRAELHVRRADQDRTLDAIHRLEAVMGAAAARREGPWREDVAAAMQALDVATGEEEANAARPESLLSDIARTQPRLRNRVRGLRVAYRQARDTIAALRAELDKTSSEVDVSDIRQRIAWLLAALHYQRARESDLIYEAYYDAFHRDVGDDARGQR